MQFLLLKKSRRTFVKSIAFISALSLSTIPLRFLSFLPFPLSGSNSLSDNSDLPDDVQPDTACPRGDHCTFSLPRISHVCGNTFITLYKIVVCRKHTGLKQRQGPVPVARWPCSPRVTFSLEQRNSRTSTLVGSNTLQFLSSVPACSPVPAVRKHQLQLWEGSAPSPVHSHAKGGFASHLNGLYVEHTT